MRASVHWHPVLPSRALPGGDTICASLVAGHALALWRSATGQIQAWEDRCPHRSVALSLGRVLGDRLACAYHGWEYAADSGRCVAIPAMPDQPVPGKVCVKTYRALERQGMVWVAPGDDSAAPPDAAPAAAAHFLRSFAVATPVDATERSLAALAFMPAGPCQWRGHWAGHALHLWVLDAAADWCQLHVATEEAPPDAATGALFNALRHLRDRLQQAES